MDPKHFQDIYFLSGGAGPHVPPCRRRGGDTRRPHLRRQSAAVRRCGPASGLGLPREQVLAPFLPFF
ncbi:uncharacterized protein G2W53_044719 [Senna tora]|uniref:Uncharacterized protein n=1 Tax=Senna tora TaxID=362788 RepID=A0A834SEG2_9FABA|nr:uncharacterized protein G2W53_044719 [Senna tora]